MLLYQRVIVWINKPPGTKSLISGWTPLIDQQIGVGHGWPLSEDAIQQNQVRTETDEEIGAVSIYEPGPQHPINECFWSLIR